MGFGVSTCSSPWEYLVPPHRHFFTLGADVTKEVSQIIINLEKRYKCTSRTGHCVGTGSGLKTGQMEV